MLGRLGRESPGRPEPRVRKRHVEAAEPLERRLHERLLLLPLGHVAGHRDRALGSAQFLGERLDAVGGARSERHPMAGLGGLARGGSADPAGGAGDQEDWIGSWHQMTRHEQ